MLLPLVKKGMDDFGPDGVEFQVGDAVEVLLAAKNKAETAEEGGALQQPLTGWDRSPGPVLPKQSQQEWFCMNLPQFSMKAI